ncbi:MAG: HAD family phosphatase [Mogibacterium sp.]|nr:HAD family phosphatase [Mogibacterium sp.]
MAENNQIRTVIFDIGRVLIEFEWKDYILGLFDEKTAIAVTEAMWKTGYWHELDRAVLTEEEILSLFYSAAPEYREEILTAFERVGECVKRLDYAIPWIEDLKARGYQVLFLSNYSMHVMSSNPAALDFLPHMDGGVFSCDVKLIKPDPAIFAAICDKYDLTPSACLFIDDNAANVEAARAFGMNAIRFKTYEQARADVDRMLGEA